jgi:hypothetical protein
MQVALVEKGPLGGTCPLLIGYADAAECGALIKTLFWGSMLPDEAPLFTPGFHESANCAP